MNCSLLETQSHLAQLLRKPNFKLYKLQSRKVDAKYCSKGMHSIFFFLALLPKPSDKVCLALDLEFEFDFRSSPKCGMSSTQKERERERLKEKRERGESAA